MNKLPPFHILFLCTGNSARSIMAEAAANDPRFGKGRLQAYSAGSQPTGQVNPFALETLARNDLNTNALSSKSWSVFESADAPQLDFIFTVCGNAAGETCPIWPGHPVTAHWGVEDPAAVEGDDASKRKAFEAAFEILSRRISQFVALPFADLDAGQLADELARIGKS